MIYMGTELQKKLIPLFHYALKPGGMLFLGTSEGIGEFDALFTALDRKAKLYQKKEDPHGLQRATLGRLLPSLAMAESIQPVANGKTTAMKKPSLREITEQTLLQQVVPAGALVNGQGDILYLHGRTGMFLEPAPGEPGINNIIKMAREGLRRELTTALHQASTTKEIIHTQGLRVKTNGHFTTVNLTVWPVTNGPGATPETPLYLVILEETLALEAPTTPQTNAAANSGDTNSHESDADARIATLKHDLQAKEEYLQSTLEELQSSTEELKSSNEEMQSVNEELQSTNEELETSREELQSINEELSTVNSELQNKVLDLSTANNDMNNLLAGTGIGTVFVDHRLRILRFTPTASTIINLIASDVGRPVSHLASNLKGYDRLAADAQSVLDTLIPREVLVHTPAPENKAYTMRIQPYRTLDNVIKGVVITFVDVTELKQAEEALRQSAHDLLRLAVVVRDAHDAVTVQDINGRIIAWNPGAVRLYGWSEAEALTMNVCDRIPRELRENALAKLHQLSQADTLTPYHTQRLTKTGAVIDVTITSTALINEHGQVHAISTTERAIGGGINHDQ